MCLWCYTRMCHMPSELKLNISERSLAFDHIHKISNAVLKINSRSKARKLPRQFNHKIHTLHPFSTRAAIIDIIPFFSFQNTHFLMSLNNNKSLKQSQLATFFLFASYTIFPFIIMFHNNTLSNVECSNSPEI